MQNIDITEHYCVARVYGLKVTFLPDPVDSAYVDEIVDIDWDPMGDPHDIWALLARIMPYRKAYYGELNFAFGKDAVDDLFEGIRDYIFGRDAFDAFEDGKAERGDVLNAAIHVAEIVFEDDDIDWADVKL